MCYVGDDYLVKYMESEFALAPGSPLYIASGAKLEALPLLCGIYRCYSRDDFWQPTNSHIAHASESLVKAHINFLICQEASSFVGNRFSTFSNALYHIFKSEDKRATFVNEAQCPLGQRVSFTGCEPVEEMSCCM